MDPAHDESDKSSDVSPGVCPKEEDSDHADECRVVEESQADERRLSLGDEVWGAKMFLQSIRSRLNKKKVFESLEMRANYPDRDFQKLPDGWNIALLGPTGAGKSSLVYTLWRAINGIDADDEEAVLKVESLQVGWSATEEPGEATSKSKGKPKAKHGTRALSSVIVQEACSECSQIRVQDTKGQQFFDDKEASYADALVGGVLKDGSTVEEQNLRYWITIGSLGFFESSAIDSAPHVILLVFDASLKSLNKVLNVDFSDAEWENKVPQLACYHRVLDKARERDLDVFVCLTHIDVYERQRGVVEGGEETRVGEAVQEELDDLMEKLSKSLSHGDRNLPMSHIFVVENYRSGKNSSDARIDLAATELLDALVESADDYIGFHCPKKSSCVIC
mmetsp:Transcript_10862/g.16537  ORF Transcript_10862/g.16537 Transcript_10862/m.16537 type:complete len:392 (-) Transcript_10862:237-1412(-)|eukprot:CAMPEP_0185027584 /NCGR_PEP_ID=MMETSP1103-20130426/12851_1 /TAXON_ID=36769 /ORGANISM="Paraphysomonas bandaiensis, Strain Caron Lab Isolate" /LENGTH=391 /DNA_ID=CAMNT_0027561675 /DNA_START=40 /DNA_END=1215 /DNA_ORIENTATION=-